MSEAENESPPAEAPEKKSKTSLIAEASLWFGIVGFVVAIFPTAIIASMLTESTPHPFQGIAAALATQLLAFIPAVACGWMALARIRRSGRRLRGRGCAIAGIVMGCLGLAVAGLWADTVIGTLELANRAACKSNLKLLILDMQNYATAHDGRLPDRLSALGIDWPYTNVIWCPSTGHFEASPKDIDAQSDYIYAGAGHRISEAEPSTIPILWDRPENHGGEGVNVAYLDGHVEWQEEVPTPVAPEPAAGAAGHSPVK